MNNRYKIALIALAVVIILVAIFGRESLQAGVRYLAPGSTEQTPAAQESTTQEPDYHEQKQTDYPPSEIQRREKQPPTRCMDGSALTVTSRDANQTNYRCGSGTIGAYMN